MPFSINIARLFFLHNQRQPTGETPYPSCGMCCLLRLMRTHERSVHAAIGHALIWKTLLSSKPKRVIVAAIVQ
jgi:hypothetical protein